MLVDIEKLISGCRQKYDQLPYTGDVKLSKEVAKLLEAELRTADSNSSVVVYPFSIRFSTKVGHKADLPSSSLWYGYSFWELANALNSYDTRMEQIRTILTDEYGITKQDLKAYLKHFPSHDIFSPNRKIGEAINEVLTERFGKEDNLLFMRFFTERAWWFKQISGSDQTSGKTLDRGDVYRSCLVLAARVIVANSDKIPNIIYAFAKSPELRFAFDKLNKKPQEYDGEGILNIKDSSLASYKIECNGAKNIIYYGAPGTGKSFSISQEISESNSIRTVFHPDTQYSDFVGCLKPLMQDNGNVGYGFRAGPFTEAVIKAVNQPDQIFSLVIEEINRAAAAAVFGEVFQLLDRDGDGSSSYPINISDPDMLGYLNSKTNNAFVDGKLKIPSNLSLLATMNSSDQAVMPLDTAFKRRWEFKYLPIDYSKASKGVLNIPISNGKNIHVAWADFARIINDQLADQRIPEDRLLGHRFISDIELTKNVDDVLKGKLFMYLWDDVLRHGRQGIIFKDTLESSPLSTFGQLASAFERGVAVFNYAVETELENCKITDDNSEEESAND